MGAMTNAMGSIGGAINKVGKGAIGGVNKVGGQMGVPGLGGKPQQPGAPAQPGAAPGQVAIGPTAATAQPGEGGAPPQATGPAGPQVGGQITPGAGGAPPFLQGGLPGLGGMKRQLMQNAAQLTAQGALGKQPAQTTMQKMMGGGGIWGKLGKGMGGGTLPYINNRGGGPIAISENFPTQRSAQQPGQQAPQPQQPQGILAPDERFPVDPRMQF